MPVRSDIVGICVNYCTWTVEFRRTFADVDDLNFGPGERDVLGEGISAIVYGAMYQHMAVAVYI